jgi:hypothetical protein
MQNDQQKKLAAVVLLIILLGGAVYYLKPFQGFTWITVQKIQVDPQGYPDANSMWKGSFWAMTTALSASDDIAGFTVPVNQTDTETVNGTSYTFHTGASIEIRVDPDQPYLLRRIREVPYQVTPLTYRNWQSKLAPTGGAAPGEADALAVNAITYDWAETGWEVHTPFWVTILKDGVEVARVQLDNGGNQTIATIPVPSIGKAIRIENLGYLSGLYTEPQVPIMGQMAFFSHDYAYDMASAFRYISYDKGVSFDPARLVGDQLERIREGSSDAYSLYWYGQYYRWASKYYAWNPPAAYQEEWWGAGMIDTSRYGGWKASDDTLTYKRDPIAPVIFPADKSLLPADKRAYYSLIEFLEFKGVANLATGLFKTFDSWILDTANMQVKVNVPWGAYGIPLVTFRVPTELADTWVDRPQVSNVQPALVWASTGTKDQPNLISTDKIVCTLTQMSTVTSSVRVFASVNVPQLAVWPSQRTETLGPGQSVIVYFDVTNGGVPVDTSFKVTVQCYEMYGNTLTGEDFVIGIAKKINVQQTLLRITVIDPLKTGNQWVSGINIQIQYPATGGTTQSGFSDQYGVITWTLATNGVPYSGDVSISTMETYTYKASFQTVSVTPGIPKEVIVNLVRQGAPPPPTIPWEWIVVGSVIAVMVVAIIALAKKRKPPVSRRIR